MNKDSKFWNKIARRYAAKPVPDETVYEQKIERTRKRLSKDMAVLELGCGTGTTALKHAPFVNSVLAIDYSEEMIQIANEKKTHHQVNNVEFRCASIESLEHEREHFDVIMAHSVLHLLKDKQATIAKVHRLLKPDGLFVSGTACLTGLIVLLRPLWPLVAATKMVPPVRFFSSEELVNDHINAGFLIEERWQPTKMNIFLIARKSK